MADHIRRILYPTFVLTVIATVWTLGWAQSVSERAERGLWAPQNPPLFQFHEDVPAAAAAAREP